MSVAAFAVPAPFTSAQTKPGPAQPAVNAGDSAQAPNRATSYFHSAMAEMYEEEAMNTGKPEYLQHAIEEYK